MDNDHKLKIIKRNASEILGEDILLQAIKQKNKSIYLGTSITGSPHIAYFVWASKLADFAKAGFKVKLLLADIHGALDNTPWPILEKRYKYYEKVIPLLFEPLGVKKSQLEFIKGSSFQLSKQYVSDLLKLSTFVSVHDANKAASEVVKLGDNPRLSGLLYPLMQALDEQYLDVDAQLGGLDQRKIFTLAIENLSKLGYKKRAHIMTPLIPGLVGAKMSSSVPTSKIDLLDDEQTTAKKINAAECDPANANNGILAFLKYVVFPLKQDNHKKLSIERPEKFGGPLHYDNYEHLERDFLNRKVHPLDIKNTLTKEVNALLAPIRKQHSALTKLYKDAYSE